MTPPLLHSDPSIPSGTYMAKNRMPQEAKLPENLSELQRIIITNMLQKPKITYAQLVNITGKSREAIRKNINSLKKAGIVIRIGPDKGGHWQVITDLLKVDDK